MSYTLLDFCGGMSSDEVTVTINRIGLEKIVNLDWAIHYVLSDGYVIVFDIGAGDYEAYSTEHSEEGL